MLSGFIFSFIFPYIFSLCDILFSIRDSLFPQKTFPHFPSSTSESLKKLVLLLYWLSDCAFILKDLVYELTQLGNSAYLLKPLMSISRLKEQNFEPQVSGQ